MLKLWFLKKFSGVCSVQWRSCAALVPSLWLQSLPICDISNCWDESREEISLQWVDWGRQLYVSLLSWMRWLQRKIQMIYCTPSQTTLTLEKKKLKKERPTSGCFSSIRRFFFHEMKRFHQIPHKLALFMYLLILKVQCFSDGTTSGWSFHWLKEILPSPPHVQRSSVLTSSMF